MRSTVRVAPCFFIVFAIALVASRAEGQVPAPTSPVVASAELPFAVDGPPVPVPPAVIARDASGRATIRAVRIEAPLRIDGVLDDALYGEVSPISDFIQVEPVVVG